MITFLAGIVVLITHALEAVTGFGCTVLALPFVTALLGMSEGIVLLTVLGWMIALYFVVINWRKIDWKQYLIITGVAGAGLPLGIHLSKELALPTLKMALAVFIVIASTIQFIRATRPATEGGRKLPLPVLGSFLFLGGIVHGIFSSGGPLIVLYATRTLTDKGKFRATLCLLWTTLNPMIMWKFAQDGKMDAAFAARLGIMLPFLAGGIVLGDIIHHRVNPVVFRKVVFMSLLVVGCFMFYMAIPKKPVATPASPVPAGIVTEAARTEKPAVVGQPEKTRNGAPGIKTTNNGVQAPDK